MPDTPSPVEKLQELLAAIRTHDDPRRAAAEWKQAFRLLEKTDVPPRRFTAVVGMRDVAGLAGLIEQLENPEAAPTENAPDPDTCRKALQAFRKRSKLTRLDDESKLGHSPLSKGSDRRLGAITPPGEWPRAVWDQLVRQGKLRYLGDGMYELAER